MRPLALGCFACLLAAVNQSPVLSQGRATQVLSQPRSVLRISELDTEPNGTTERPLPTSFPSLQPRSVVSEAGLASNDDARSGALAGSTITVASGLAIVLGLFAAFVWGSKKLGHASPAKGSIPKEVMQAIGSTNLDPRTRITMLRCGNRILVLSQTSGATNTLCEISDPDEIRLITAACLGQSKSEFASTLRSIEKEPARGNFIGSESSSGVAPKRSRLFTSA